MRWWRGLLFGILIGALLGGVFVSGYTLGQHRPARATAAGAFDIVWTVQQLLTDKFVGEVPPAQKQAYGAAEGLAASFGDPYTVFVEPVKREMERDQLRGQFGGIGAYMGRNDAGDLVLTMMRDRPAARAGIQDGDILLEVDGTPITAAMTVEEVVALVRGDIGAKVTLKLRRPGADALYTVTVTRERIETPSVEWRVLDAERHVGYLRVSIFGERTAQELRDGITALAGQGVNKVVFDLRGNGGGLVDAAIEVTSQFLRDGDVLREVKRGGQERFYPVKKLSSPAQGWDLVVLVDAGTASASEIVSGALRDAGRAVLIGEKTYGKGSVQEVHEFADGSSLHVTIARWLTPKRNTIDKTGLEPDITVNITQEERAAGRDPQLARAQAWLNGEK